jgi:ERCC4-related helicase
MEAFGMKYPVDPLKPASYQLIPLAKLLASSLACIMIADGVGAGKTISASYIMEFARAKGKKPGFVVCSPTMIPKWLFELHSKFNATATPIRSMEDLETAKDESTHRSAERRQPIYVMSNAILFKATRDNYPESSVTVFDEIHTYRNPDTQWFKGCLELANVSQIRIGLSATPINNTLEDLAAEIAILLARYDTDTVSAAVNDLWNTDRDALTGAVITRFTKDKLGLHFADRKIDSVTISYPSDYVRSVVAAINKKTDNGTMLEQITYYRIAASGPWAFWTSMGDKRKRDQTDPKADALEKVLEDKTITHWLVFCEFAETVEFLSHKIVASPTYVLTGDTPMFDRQPLVESFRNSSRAVLLLTSVGSEGLDLQFCGGLVNYDLHWNPMKLEQRIGRIDRIGQERKSIRIVNLHVLNSIDERVLSVIRRKLQTISHSMFASAPILSHSDSRHSGPMMYSEETLAHELGAGSSLVETLKLNADADARDYDALQYVDVSLCDPTKLSDPSKTIESSSLVRNDIWIRRVSKDADSLLNLLNYYS